MEYDPLKLAELSGLSEDAIPEWGMAIVGYIDVDGESRFETTTYGSPTIGTLLGVLELTKHDILMYWDEQCQEEEED